MFVILELREIVERRVVYNQSISADTVLLVGSLGQNETHEELPRLQIDKYPPAFTFRECEGGHNLLCHSIRSLFEGDTINPSVCLMRKAGQNEGASQ